MNLQDKDENIKLRDSASAEGNDWINACDKAGVDTYVFDIFRSIPVVKEVIDGTPTDVVHQYLQRIINIYANDKTKLEKILSAWEENDASCAPSNTKICQVNNIKYCLTAMSGRHIVNVLNYLKLIGNSSQRNQLNICEIGAGLGGEYSFFMKLQNIMGDFGVRSYHIYDLPSSQPVIEKFCSAQGISKPKFGNIYDSNREKVEYDLVISNAAFSEMRGQLINDYYESVILKAKKGYFLCNFHSHESSQEQDWSVPHFMQKLVDSGKNPFLIEDIKNFVSPYDDKSASLVVFGFDDPLSLLPEVRYPKFKLLNRRVLNKLNQLCSSKF
jgi:hypothetical protein